MTETTEWLIIIGFGLVVFAVGLLWSWIERRHKPEERSGPPLPKAH